MRYPSLITVVVLVAMFGIRSGAAQDVDYGGEAVSVARQFVKVEMEGGRTTLDGWRKVGNQFFLHPEPPPQICAVTVVSEKYYPVLTSLTEATGAAKVAVSFPLRYGTIDQQLRLTLAGSGNSRVPVLAGTAIVYNLVYSPRRWELDADWNEKEVTGYLHQALIADFSKELVLDLPAAIVYVTQMRSKTTDPTIQKNADATLAGLAKLKE